MKNTFKILEFSNIKDWLKENAFTDAAKEEIEKLVPIREFVQLQKSLRDTSEAKTILEEIGSPPLISLQEAEPYLYHAESGACLQAEELEYMASLLTAVKRMKDFLARGRYLQVGMVYYEEQLDSLEEVRNEIQDKIRGQRVDDFATPLLRELRQNLTRMEEKIRAKADSLAKSQKLYLSDSFITTRNGRICLPVKKEYRQKVAGKVLDQSATGTTFFIEPTAVGKLYDELAVVQMEEENEERRILYTLSVMLSDYAGIFRENIRVMEKLDFFFAKGKLAIDMNAIQPEFVADRRIYMKGGRHPFLPKEECIPLDFQIGDGIRGVIITGPNTGGKTVAIKTVGLLNLMAQCGLQVPCERAELCQHSHILCDIGDGQNIAENLSTFSSHIKNTMDILEQADAKSLVIMDELGSGTDPLEGMGIAVAILEKLRASGCLFLVTTHYPEVKTYADHAMGIQNARMAFDKESLRPLYQMEIGEAGESCAFYIAKRLGMPEDMLTVARQAAYGESDALFATLPEVRVSDAKEDGETKNWNNKKNAEQIRRSFCIGDSVMVLPEKKTGIVYKAPDEKGIMIVQVQQSKISINHKRVKLLVASEELYPPDYDFSIVFDSVEHRKARHEMQRKHCEGLEILSEESKNRG